MKPQTPTPWHYQEKSDAYTHIIRSADEKYIIQGSQDLSGRVEADMRFVVHAVNCHDDLLEALEKLLDHVTVDNLRTNWEDVIKLTTTAINKAQGDLKHKNRNV